MIDNFRTTKEGRPHGGCLLGISTVSSHTLRLLNEYYFIADDDVTSILLSALCIRIVEARPPERRNPENTPRVARSPLRVRKTSPNKDSLPVNSNWDHTSDDADCQIKCADCQDQKALRSQMDRVKGAVERPDTEVIDMCFCRGQSSIEERC